MKAIAKLIPITYSFLEKHVVFKLDGKLIQTEITSVGTKVLEGTVTIGLMGGLSIPIKEINKIVAQSTTLSNGYKNQPKDVICFVADYDTKNYELDEYSKQIIIDKELLDTEITIEFTNSFKSVVKLINYKK